jgi:hypothetical protein
MADGQVTLSVAQRMYPDIAGDILEDMLGGGAHIRLDQLRDVFGAPRDAASAMAPPVSAAASAPPAAVVAAAAAAAAPPPVSAPPAGVAGFGSHGQPSARGARPPQLGVRGQLGSACRDEDDDGEDEADNDDGRMNHLMA